MEERRQNTFILDKGEISIVKASVVLVTLLTLGWGVVVTIVLPINSMQIQLANIQATLKSSTQNVTALQAEVAANSSDILLLKQEQLNGNASQTTINNK